MTTKLTKTILRNTAARLWDGTPTDPRCAPTSEEYMCFALEREVGCLASDSLEPQFHALLETHGVSLDGELAHKGVAYSDAEGRGAEAQALRFDFLNLLAESL
ncbi:hypothetical protein [Variovorax paradoxus]|uniref:hypothetical protein n=1 Tax=Variovorax paradoxus TaxID=34073 RepID=UPI00285DDA8C|nr:hypothetical protein [Variovorax paradoxus]MDR6455528.1 hypothetical protein [Variovorax paradoxus]